MAEAIPRKLFYKLQEVCELTDTQPYVLRFWESEFSQLAPTRSRNGQRLYRKRDIDLVLEIKRLLNDEGQTIAAAREKLGMGEGPAPFLEELFEPPPVEARAAAVAAARLEIETPRKAAAPTGNATTRKVAAGLRDILGLLDQTDRRLSGGD